jgi:transcriptional regulator with XRE-family HTH domain
LHIPDATDNVIPYEIYPKSMGKQKILKAKRLSIAIKLCTGSPETVADKIRFARLIAGLRQEDLATNLKIDRATLLRYENGQVSEENMRVDILIQIAVICGQEQYFCCNPYHVFLAEDAGRQIKQYRKQMGLTQKQLAMQCGVALTTVKRWESNEHKPPISIWRLVFCHSDILLLRSKVVNKRL